MRTWILCSVLSVCMFSMTGCGGSACDQAVDKLKACWNQVDCSTRAANLQSVCNSTKASFLSLPPNPNCTGTAKMQADTINNCTLDPTKDCACQ